MFNRSVWYPCHITNQLDTDQQQSTNATQGNVNLSRVCCQSGVRLIGLSGVFEIPSTCLFKNGRYKVSHSRKRTWFHCAWRVPTAKPAISCDQTWLTQTILMNLGSSRKFLWEIEIILISESICEMTIYQARYGEFIMKIYAPFSATFHNPGQSYYSLTPRQQQKIRIKDL